MKKNIAEIIEVSNEVYDKGLVSGKSGNISVRFKKDDKDLIAITPTLKCFHQYQLRQCLLHIILIGILK